MAGRLRALEEGLAALTERVKALEEKTAFISVSPPSGAGFTGLYASNKLAEASDQGKEASARLTERMRQILSPPHREPEEPHAEGS